MRRDRALAAIIGTLIGAAFGRAGLVGTMSLWSVLPGLGGAAGLWGFAGWVLNSVARGCWLVSRAN